MSKARLFDFLLFATALAVALESNAALPPLPVYVKALLLYWLFSSLYYRLRIVTRKGNSNMDYGINYASSFGVFAGPLGAFAFEVIFRFTVYVLRKKAKTADPGEFADTFYNIGSFSLAASLGYYLYHFLYPFASGIPFGFWPLILVVAGFMSFLNSGFLAVSFALSGDIKTWKEAAELLFRSKNTFDLGKIVITNGLLFLLLEEQKWDMLIGLFVLNYIVSMSFHSKTVSDRNKFERDQFERMAYRDFLTDTYNRAYMDKMMKELDGKAERIGIVVCDIDEFKKINDSYNHGVGDLVIRHFADILKLHLEAGDTLFRSGGEEFTLILRHKTFEQCVGQVERMVRYIESRAVVAEYEERPVKLTYSASFGVYYYETGQAITMEKGYICADQLMLESKKSGRNRMTSRSDFAGA